MSKKILIVEDIPMNRRLIRDILTYQGYEVIEAENGKEAVRIAREQKPDLIIMDLQMPVMSGYDAIKILKSDPVTKDIKIIAVTSFAMSGDREKVLAAGFDNYISKPINTRELPEMVKRLLEGFSD
ncbi:MAG: response regulator [Proteobacteria bacterium]|nr:response regulator [Pseudomonadota bacterium]MCG2722973.1 response regulator [Thermodesulfovibrionales bacterium]